MEAEGLTGQVHIAPFGDVVDRIGSDRRFPGLTATTAVFSTQLQHLGR